MSENFTSTELLIQYMDGELQGETLISVEKAISLNPEVRAEFENLKLAREAVISYGLKKQVGELHKEMMSELEEEIELQLEDFQLVEIQELLEEHGIDLGDEEIADLASFVKEAGGLEAALDLLTQLQNRQEAA